MGTPRYMLIYNHLRLSETLPHEFLTDYTPSLLIEATWVGWLGLLVLGFGWPIVLKIFK